jgi:hypothetical protein
MVGLTGLEPVTPALSRRCSNQLSYRPDTNRGARPTKKNGGGMRIRTADPLLAKQMLYQLSYAPVDCLLGNKS